jgi:hypothetical protein
MGDSVSDGRMIVMAIVAKSLHGNNATHLIEEDTSIHGAIGSGGDKWREMGRG